uniref:NADH dehydrogenase subunit 6 n=1 Tax=Darthula hardwickii TaxID=1264638 RepID=A0A0U1Z4N7_9HEMI|nr:NADH dehydrogenase subunit 6 [Darthula hardwickii]AJP09357.1 NADH dehydrogenase subunit 6 [Darthula hardwickii]
MKMMMKTMMLISMFKTMTKTPMSMGSMLLIQVTMTSLMMTYTFKSSMMSMITFLIMIGGLMIIFMYISSISSNEKMKMNLSMMIMSLIFMLTPTENIPIQWKLEEFNLLINNEEHMTLSIMYNKTMMMTTLMAMYLMLTMMSINKILKHFKGPLRSKTYE